MLDFLILANLVMSYLLIILNVPNLPLEIDLLRQRISELELATRKLGTADSVYVFIDNSNVFIQGKKAMAMRELVQEHLVRIDYGRLVEMIQRNRNMGSVPFVAGSTPPPEDTIWRYLRRLG